MMEIEINNDPVQIPTFKELTVKQYKQLTPFIAESGMCDVLRYVAITTNVDYQKALHFEFKNTDRLNSMLGEFLFIAGDMDAAPKNGFIETTKPRLLFKYGRYIHDLRKKKVNSVGYRIVLEQYLATKPSYLDMYVFMAALVINSEAATTEQAFDYESVQEINEALQAYNAFDVLTLGSFFFWKWRRKESGESLLFRMLKRVVSTSLRLRSRKLVLLDSRNITPLRK